MGIPDGGNVFKIFNVEFAAEALKLLLLFILLLLLLLLLLYSELGEAVDGMETEDDTAAMLEEMATLAAAACVLRAGIEIILSCLEINLVAIALLGCWC